MKIICELFYPYEKANQIIAILDACNITKIVIFDRWGIEGKLKHPKYRQMWIAFNPNDYLLLLEQLETITQEVRLFP